MTIQQSPHQRCLGIDEAGRGCIMGPLVMAGVVITTPQDNATLLAMGCTDSKNFGNGHSARAKRNATAKRICAHFAHHIVCLQASEVDYWVQTQTLNAGECFLAKQILYQADYSYAILDGERIFASLVQSTIIASNKADAQYPAVMAASIVAKDFRDSALIDIYTNIGFPKHLAGGGYINNTTFELIKGYIDRHGVFPPHFRHSYNWRALRNWYQKKTNLYAK